MEKLGGEGAGESFDGFALLRGKVGKLGLGAGKFGFADEGRRIQHIRRANGERWDLIEMGLLL